MRRLIVLTAVTLSVLAGPSVGTAAAARYGPFSTYSACVQSAANREFHGYIITRSCYWSGAWYYSAYYG